MQTIHKPITRIILLFSMVAILQCCCCVLPIRWRRGPVRFTTQSPPVQAGEAVMCIVERGDRLVALSTGGESFASQDGGKTWSQAPQGILTERDCLTSRSTGGGQPGSPGPE